MIDIDYGTIGLDSRIVPLNSPYMRFYTPELGGASTYDRNSVSATSLGKGMITTPVNLGSSISSGYIRIDGPRGRIISNDGTTNRIVIGNV
jgi:hypothetical protein